ncbi:cytochrome P450, partial [Flammula alnicola]
GGVIHLRVFSRRLVVLNNEESAFELFEKRSATYSERAPRQMAYLCGFRDALIFQMYNEDTRKARKWLQGELNKRAVQERRGLCEREAVRFVQKLARGSKDIGQDGRLLAASVILMVSYGYEAKPKDDSVVATSLEVMRYLEKVITPNAYLVDALPFLRHLPSWFPGAGFQIEAKRCRKLVSEMVTVPYHETLQRMVRSALFSSNGFYGSALPSLISKHAEKLQETGDSKLLMWTAAQLFGGGSLISTIKFFFLAMILHQDIQRKAQAEVDSVLCGTRLPNISDRESMPYLECILKEIYRWRPVAPLVAHSSLKDDVFNGQIIKAGTVVMANVWAMTHNEEMYPDPDKFIPERFLVPEARDPRDLVFGFGRRICPGIHLAEDVLWMMLATTIATLNVLPALDATGRVVLPEDDKYTSGVVV